MALGSIQDTAPGGDVYRQQWKALGAWFLGPRGENHDVFLDTFSELLQRHVSLRKKYFPADPSYITEELRQSEAFQNEIKEMQTRLIVSSKEMGGCVPFFSPRYQAHMLWDTTMPSVLGYMSAMLFNQNNVDSAASPVTTVYEQAVGQQLCQMLGFNLEANKHVPVGWGHVTCGGSIANIEALWASRNVKFLSLAIKNALLKESLSQSDVLTVEQANKGLETTVKVYVKEKGIEDVALKNTDSWQLLNMDIDEICELTDKVIDNMGLSDNKPVVSSFKTLIETESVVNLGLFKFMKRSNLEKSPVYTCPANNHYSWPKGGTILGMGSDALIPISLDVNFRQSLTDLKKKLEQCLADQIPVISVTAVIGSTEESAVDPIREMYNLREDFKKRGLNFALLADAAWGGYFKTMIIGDDCSEREHYRSNGFVPHCPLTPYVKDQYAHIQLADTITIDPHKSGFCPYPGGALCYRNGKMRYNIAVFHPDVYHGEDDPTMGVYGIEGSKPGAAPAGILMSHNTIGLDKAGYGRILGQCTTTTKLFYCLWLTVARDDDPFICLPLQHLPEGYTLEEAKTLIKKKMAYKSMSEVYKCTEAFEFLKKCGPDTMINTFAVNIKGNKDVEKSNELQIKMSDVMNIYVGSAAKRVPLILMQSGFDAVKHGAGLADFKERIGLVDSDNKINMNIMINTCMNPWQSNESIFSIGDLFREIVLNCIGCLEDTKLKHRFIVVSDIVKEVNDDGNDRHTFFIEYLTSSDQNETRYQVSAKVSLMKEDSLKFRQFVRHHQRMILETQSPEHLHDLMHSTEGFDVVMWDGYESMDEPNYVTLFPIDVPRYQRLDESQEVVYPKLARYFVYGDANRVIMSHVITKLPDFQETVMLAEKPHSLTPELLDLGVMVSINDVEGSPIHHDGEMISPLQRDSYDVSFKGELFSTIKTTVNIEDKLYFNEVDDWLPIK